MFNDQAELATASSIAGDRKGGDAETRRIRSLLRVAAPLPRKADRRVTPAEAQLAAHLGGETERARNYLYAFHRQWFMNIAAYLGTAGVRTESVARALKVNLKTATSRVTHRSNKIGGYVRRLVGYLARSQPELQFVAADVDDPIQVDYAKGASEWTAWHREYDHWRKKRLELMHHRVCLGIGITKAITDPTGGPRATAVDEDGNVVVGSDGKPFIDARTGRPKTYATPVPRTVIVPPFHYVYNINARNDDELSFNGEESWRSFRELNSLMPGVVAEFGLAPEPQFTNNSALYERQIMQSVGPQQSYAIGGQDTSEPGCTVRELYIAPYYLDRETWGDDFFELGAHVIMAQGKFLVLEPNDLLRLEGVNPRTDWNPYTIWPCFQVPGRMVPQGLPDNVIPISEGRDFIISRIREAQRMMGQPKWFVQRGSITDQINNESAQTILYSPGFNPPVAYTPPPLPAYILQAVEILDRDMEDVSSQPPMMQGQAQGQVRSGMAVQLIQEQALTQFTPLVEMQAWCEARHARQLLLREIQSDAPERRIPQRTKSGNWTQTLFFAKHMNPEFMVRIVPGTEMPKNDAVNMSLIDRLVSWQMLTPGINPQHADVINRALRTEVPYYSPDDSEQALSQSHYENWLLLDRPGDVPVTHAFFNHRVHINEHIRFLNSQRAQQRIRDEVAKFGFSPFLDAMMEHVGGHKGHLIAIQQGLIVPQPVPPFEGLALDMHGAQAGGGGGGGGPMGGGGGAPRGRPGAFTGTGSQNGFARPPQMEANAGSTDQMGLGGGMQQLGEATMPGAAPMGGGGGMR